MFFPGSNGSSMLLNNIRQGPNNIILVNKCCFRWKGSTKIRTCSSSWVWWCRKPWIPSFSSLQNHKNMAEWECRIKLAFENSSFVCMWKEGCKVPQLGFLCVGPTLKPLMTRVCFANFALNDHALHVLIAWFYKHLILRPIKKTLHLRMTFFKTLFKSDLSIEIFELFFT